MLTLLCTAEDCGKRIDKFISDNAEMLTRSAVQGLIGKNAVTADGKAVSKNYKIRGTETIEVEIPDAEPMDAVPENIPLDIVYEDEDLLVVNKPKGMVVHPAAGNYTGTLVNALLHHCGDTLSGIGGVIRPGIVHRIDKDTSGLLVVAKNDEAHLFLSEEIKEHKVSRVYHAVAIGKVKENVTIDLPIGRHPTDRKKMTVTDKNSKNAITHVEVLESFDTATYVRCILETGRTHQIRVHLSHTGHPLVGDLVYGSPKYPQNQKYAALCEGQCLHAKELTLTHPRTKETMHFECALPTYFEELLSLLGKVH